MTSDDRNWAGNYRFAAQRVHRPSTLAQVQEIVAASSRLKVVGTRHAFNGIADTDGDHLSLQHLNGVVALDRAAHTVTVDAGIRYGELGAELCRQGFALHNLASLPHISVAGAVATATHGSGDASGNLATAVSALEMVVADGSVVALSRQQHGEMFNGVVVALGALGVVTKLTLHIEPSYEVAQVVYEDLSFAALEENFSAITSSAVSVSLFTDWRRDAFHQVWLKHRVAPHGSIPTQDQFFGARAATQNLHPLPGHGGENCTEQMGVAGPWHERLPHFRLAFTPSSGDEVQSEWFVTREQAAAALRALTTLRARLVPLVQVTEVRTIAADELWLSPCYRRASVGIHFTWKADWPAVAKLLPDIEAALASFDARPHWAKLFTMAPVRVQASYAMLPRFRQLQQRFDPEGKFRNAFVDAYVGGDQAAGTG